MTIYRIFDIAWDTDGTTNLEDLPQEIFIDATDLDDLDDLTGAALDAALDERTGDRLSDGTGWCVNGFEREIVKENG